jgi:toxin ParE1/3/4
MYLNTYRPIILKQQDLKSTLILDTVGLLDRTPSMGRPGRVPGTRELVIAGTPYIVAYRAKRRSIEILRVLHGAQKWTDI